MRAAFPAAAILIPEGFEPFDGGGAGRQWFSVRGVTEENRPERVAQALPPLEAYVKQAQARFGLLQSDTALAGFSQGAIMALELVQAHDGMAGRVIAFSGRYAQLPKAAPQYTTLHLLHLSLIHIWPCPTCKTSARLSRWRPMGAFAARRARRGPVRRS